MTDQYQWANLERRWAEEMLSKMQNLTEREKRDLIELRKVFGYAHISFSELPVGTGITEGIA